MKLIDREDAIKYIQNFANKEIYLHLEMTMGAYTAHKDKKVHPASNFAKNVPIKFMHGTLSDSFPFRIGLKLDKGWVYAEGLTHYEYTDDGVLLFSGNDDEGRLIAAVHLSDMPL